MSWIFFSPRGPPPINPEGRAGWESLRQPWPEGLEGWGQRVASSFVFLNGASKSDGLMRLESQGGNFPGSIQVVSPLCLAL